MNIGENIKKYRKEKGLTQAELAKLSNVSRVAIGNYERSDRVPTTDIASKIADALQVDVNTLMGKSSNSENNKSKQVEIIDDDIRRIERAKNKMPKNKQKDMINMLKIAFSDYFDDED